MLEINNYNSAILHDINLTLKQNENLVILGENGAGKSTLAKVICNLIPNQNVKIEDELVSLMSEKQRAKLINYIPPKFTIFDEYMTLKEFLELCFIGSVDNKKIKEVIKLLKLERLQDRACLALSSGEKQLLLLASSILHNAKLTIFDELTANLDISRLKEVFDIFNSKQLQQKIVITHNLDLAYALKYKILYLKEGKIEFIGSSEEFFSQENLTHFYGKTLKKLDEHLVVNL